MINNWKVALMLLLSVGAETVVASVSEPIVHLLSWSDDSYIKQMSNNGRWVVANGHAEDATKTVGAKLYDVSSGLTIELTDEYDENGAEIYSGAGDVTDDGLLVVGSYGMAPAVWHRESTSDKAGVWTLLPLPDGWDGGHVWSVTPDGRYAVGLVNTETNLLAEEGVLWDLTGDDAVIVPTPGLPTFDRSGMSQGMNRFVGVSADGRYVLGTMSYSYPSDLITYVYDRETSAYKVIGYTENNKNWVAEADGIFKIEGVFSPDGRWVTGESYLVKDIAGSDFANEYSTAYRYGVVDATLETYDNVTDDVDVIGTAIGNDGTVFAATPATNPYRTCKVRKDGYWFDLELIMSQTYGFDLLAKTGEDNSGTPIAVSDDGKTLALLFNPTASYVLQLPKTFTESCDGVDLLADYNVVPASGSSFSKIRSVEITFDRNVEIVGNGTNIELLDNDGNKVDAALGATVNGSKVVISFWPTFLSEGAVYSVRIPCGTFAINGDSTRKNNEIVIKYYGRADKPVQMVEAAPADGTSLAKIDSSTNPIIINFDSEVIAVDDAVGYLYNGDEQEPFAELVVMYGGNQVALYPSTPQYLYDGNTYRVVLPAGSVTDVTGNGANEKVELTYKGVYVREISADDNILFSEDFSSGVAGMLLYDGDKLNPGDEAVAIGFADNNNYPWWVARDDDATDMAATSHSIYSPSGKSDDWMVSPQIFVPDDLCYLCFDSQSYRFASEDYLKVYVIVDDNVYGYINDNIVAGFKENGTLVYDEKQSPGETEDVLMGEWTPNEVSLAEYAGKNIYIAFVNDNEAQSMVFVDNVRVLRDMHFLTTLSYDPIVVDGQSATIRGRIEVASEVETYSSIKLTLKDANDEVVDEILENELALDFGDVYAFEFAPMTLASGVENNFTIEISLDEENKEVMGVVKNLLFMPTKRVVLEEYTGATCKNCPLGILAIEHIRNIYRDRFIPVSIHTYTGDRLAVGVESYGAFFPWTGAPQGMLNRSGVLSSPMISNSGSYYFSAVDINGDKLWYDLVRDEMEQLAEADVDFVAEYDAINNVIEIPCTVKYAMNASNLNVGLFAVLLEDGVKYAQTNNFATVSDPNLGEFGVGGAYASSTISPFYHEDVARHYVGATFNGTYGLIPSEVVAGQEYATTITMEVPSTIADINKCKVVVMLIDGNSDKVVNANCIGLSGDVATVYDVNETMADVVVTGNEVNVVANGNLCVELYTTGGNLLCSGRGEGVVTLDVKAYSGVVIAKIVAADKNIVKKIIIK